MQSVVGEIVALGVIDIEDVADPEPGNPGMGERLASLGIFDSVPPYAGAEDGDALRTLLHTPAERRPRMEAGYPGGVRSLQHDEEGVVGAVASELGRDG